MCLTGVKSRQRRELSLGMVLNYLKRRGCLNTLAEHNEVAKLELPRAWEIFGQFEAFMIL